MSIKSAQAKQQLRNSDGTFANENKKAGLPSNDMIQRASKLLAKSSATVVDILPRMNAGDSRISRFGFLFDTTKQEGRGR